jgi:hypothetical protein
MEPPAPVTSNDFTVSASAVQAPVIRSRHAAKLFSSVFIDWLIRVNNIAYGLFSISCNSYKVMKKYKNSTVKQ